MNLEEALKREDKYIRVVCGNNRWLVWDGKKWAVYFAKYKAHHTDKIYSGDNLEDATRILIEGD